MCLPDGDYYVEDRPSWIQLGYLTPDCGYLAFVTVDTPIVQFETPVEDAEMLQLLARAREDALQERQRLGLPAVLSGRHGQEPLLYETWGTGRSPVLQAIPARAVAAGLRHRLFGKTSPHYRVGSGAGVLR